MQGATRCFTLGLGLLVAGVVSACSPTTGKQEPSQVHHEPKAAAPARTGDSFNEAMTEEVKYERAVSDVKNLVDNIKLFRLKTSEYPDLLDDLHTLKGAVIPEHDPWGRPYEFMVDDAGFTLVCRGLSEEDETDDVWYSSESGRIRRPGD